MASETKSSRSSSDQLVQFRNSDLELQHKVESIPKVESILKVESIPKVELILVLLSWFFSLFASFLHRFSSDLHSKSLHFIPGLRGLLLLRLVIIWGIFAEFSLGIILGINDRFFLGFSSLVSSAFLSTFSSLQSCLFTF